MSGEEGTFQRLTYPTVEEDFFLWYASRNDDERAAFETLATLDPDELVAVVRYAQSLQEPTLMPVPVDFDAAARDRSVTYGNVNPYIPEDEGFDLMSPLHTYVPQYDVLPSDVILRYEPTFTPLAPIGSSYLEQPWLYTGITEGQRLHPELTAVAMRGLESYRDIERRGLRLYPPLRACTELTDLGQRGLKPLSVHRERPTVSLLLNAPLGFDQGYQALSFGPYDQFGPELPRPPFPTELAVPLFPRKPPDEDEEPPPPPPPPPPTPEQVLQAQIDAVEAEAMAEYGPDVYALWDGDSQVHIISNKDGSRLKTYEKDPTTGEFVPVPEPGQSPDFPSQNVFIINPWYGTVDPWGDLIYDAQGNPITDEPKLYEGIVCPWGDTEYVDPWGEPVDPYTNLLTPAGGPPSDRYDPHLWQHLRPWESPRGPGTIGYRGHPGGFETGIPIDQTGHLTPPNRELGLASWLYGIGQDLLWAAEEGPVTFVETVVDPFLPDIPIQLPEGVSQILILLPTTWDEILAPLHAILDALTPPDEPLPTYEGGYYTYDAGTDTYYWYDDRGFSYRIKKDPDTRVNTYWHPDKQVYQDAPPQPVTIPAWVVEYDPEWYRGLDAWGRYVKWDPRYGGWSYWNPYAGQWEPVPTPPPRPLSVTSWDESTGYGMNRFGHYVAYEPWTNEYYWYHPRMEQWVSYYTPPRAERITYTTGGGHGLESTPQFYNDPYYGNPAPPEGVSSWDPYWQTGFDANGRIVSCREVICYVWDGARLTPYFPPPDAIIFTFQG